MKTDLLAAGEAGADGVVFGILDTYGDCQLRAVPGAGRAGPADERDLSPRLRHDRRSLCRP